MIGVLHNRNVISIQKAGVIGTVELVTLLVVMVYFLYRLAFEETIPRETFAITYGVTAGIIALIVTLRLGLNAFVLPVYVYALYLIIRFILMGKWNGIIAISLFQYLIPLAFYLIGIHIWILGRYRVVFELFVVLIAVSLLGGLVNFYSGWAEPIFALNDYDKIMVSESVVKRAGSLAGNSLATGYLAMIGILFAIAQSRWQRYLIPLFILSLLSSLSRGAIIMVLVGIPVWQLAHCCSGKSKPRQSNIYFVTKIVVLILLSVSLVIYLVEPGLYNVFIERFIYNMFDFNEEGNSIRVLSWLAALDLWISAPIFGVGFGVLGGSAVKYGISELAPESMYLKLLGELGIIGLLCYCSAITIIVLRAIKRMRSDSGRDRLLAESLLACVTATLFGGLFLQNIEYDFFAVLFWLFMGGLTAYGAQVNVDYELYSLDRSN